MEAVMTIDEVALHICAYLGDHDGSKHFAPVMRFLVPSLQQISNLLSFSINSKVITVESNMTAALPKDFITLTRIGVCSKHSNELIPIDHNSKICPIPSGKFTLDCCDCKKELDENNQIDHDKSEHCNICSIHHKVSDSLPYSRYHYSYLFGARANHKAKGTYRIDDTNRRILFGSGCYVEPYSKIMIEYSSTLSGADYVRIPSKALFTLQHRVASFLKKSTNEKQYERMLFKSEYRILKSSVLSYSLADFTNAVRAAYASTIKV